MPYDGPFTLTTTPHLVELKNPDTFESILSNAHQIRPFLQERSQEIEDARCLTDDVVVALINAGVFRMNMPKSWSGPELSSMQQVEVIEAVSRGDTSAGWCVMIGTDAGIYSGYLDDAVARNLYPHLDVIQAGWVYPMGVAEEIDGGYKVSGHWKFCSGSSHADVIAAGCTVHRDGEPVIGPSGKPEWRLMLAPKSHWMIEDTWHTTGLAGTASHDYTTMESSLLIPREHSFSLFEPKRDGILWQRPDTILRKMSGVPLGLSRRLIDDTSTLLQTKSNPLGTKRHIDRSQVKAAIAEAEMMLGRARAYVFNALEAQWQCLEAGQSMSDQQRADVWLSRLNAFQSAVDIARLLYETVGAEAIYTHSTPLDRGLRDALTMCQHIVGQRNELESVGALMLGADHADVSPML